MAISRRPLDVDNYSALDGGTGLEIPGSYRRTNINDIISNNVEQGTSSDSAGSSGDVRVVNVGNKKYIEGKFSDGWSRVELPENS